MWMTINDKLCEVICKMVDLVLFRAFPQYGNQIKELIESNWINNSKSKMAVYFYALYGLMKVTYTNLAMTKN